MEAEWKPFVETARTVFRSAARGEMIRVFADVDGVVHVCFSGPSYDSWGCLGEFSLTSPEAAALGKAILLSAQEAEEE